MNKIHRFAAVSAACVALTAPGVALMTPAFAEPYPWHDPRGTATGFSLAMPKAQIEHEELLRMGQQSSPVDEHSTAASPDGTAFPWETVGLVALGAVALTAGGAAVARRYQRVGTTA